MRLRSSFTFHTVCCCNLKLYVCFFKIISYLVPKSCFPMQSSPILTFKVNWLIDWSKNSQPMYPFCYIYKGEWRGLVKFSCCSSFELPQYQIVSFTSKIGHGLHVVVVYISSVSYLKQQSLQLMAMKPHICKAQVIVQKYPHAPNKMVTIKQMKFSFKGSAKSVTTRNAGFSSSASDKTTNNQPLLQQVVTGEPTSSSIMSSE